MKGFLLDTHVWLWYLGADRRLPRALAGTIEAAPDDLWLSPASVWEVGNLRARGRANFDKSLRGWFEDVMAHLPVNEAALTSEVVLAASEVDPSIRDPADRFIAATALTYQLTLLTVDEQLVQADWLETRSR